MKNPLVSVIMPVYNPGRYFRAAVDSVLAQTLTDFELLLIDDGSTDGSGAVCDEYAAKDPRVRVRHGRNGGACASRNVGLDLAEGEWLAFCDHDDRFLPEMLERLHREAVAADVDVVKCNHRCYRRFSDGRMTLHYPECPIEDRDWRLEDLRGEEGYRLLRAVGSLVWDGLFRREFLNSNGIRFDTAFTSGGEDLYFNLEVLKAVDRGRWIADSLYVHYINVGTSTSSGFHPCLQQDYLRVAEFEGRILPDDGPVMRWTRLLCWARTVSEFVYFLPGCDISESDQAAMLDLYRRRIVGDVRCPRLSTVPKNIGGRLLDSGMYRTYLRLLRLRMSIRRLLARTEKGPDA